MAGQIVRETARLVLREFDEGDVEPFYLLGSDPDVTRFIGGPQLTDLAHALQVLRSHPLADYRKHGFGRWACVLKETGTVIGFAGLKHLDDLGEVDIGYRFLPAYWGRGLATEAGAAALDDGFTRLGLGRIIGLVDAPNTASVRVLEKLGLTYVGEVEYWGKSVLKYVIEAGGRAGEAP
jgi:[ribosomal protein S5]-alanine N-acetyltransferase